MHDTERYDAVPYLAQSYAWTHPDQLESVGALFGLDTAPCDGARVLEIGSATGGNLVPMAAHLPGSTFVGVEPSGVQVARAREWSERLGLRNLRLVHGPFQGLGDEEPFDYIIAHGLYSWIPPAAREALLALCGRLLAPHGVAYISFNGMPGWSLRAPVRHLLQRHALGGSPADEIARGRELIALLVEGQEGYDSAWAVQLRTLAKLSDQAIYHDFLSPHCEAFFLPDFAARLAPHGLRYLADAEPAMGWMAARPSEYQERVRTWGGDRLGTEEAMDWVRGVAFRKALVCRGEIPEREPAARHLPGFHVSTLLREVEARQPGERAFKGSGVTVRTSHPGTIAALDHLAADGWAHFDTLWGLAAAAAGVDSEEGRQVLAEQLWAWFQVDELRLHRRPRPWSRTASARPRATPLARLQAHQGLVVNPQHETVVIDRFEAHLVGLLDGTRDRDDLVGSLVEVAQSGGLDVTHEGEPVRDAPTLTMAFSAGVDEKLRNLAVAGLLEA